MERLSRSVLKMILSLFAARSKRHQCACLPLPCCKSQYVFLRLEGKRKWEKGVLRSLRSLLEDWVTIAVFPFDLSFLAPRCPCIPRQQPRTTRSVRLQAPIHQLSAVFIPTGAHEPVTIELQMMVAYLYDRALPQLHRGARHNKGQHKCRASTTFAFMQQEASAYPVLKDNSKSASEQRPTLPKHPQVEVSACPVRKRVNLLRPWEPVATKSSSSLPCTLQEWIFHRHHQQHQQQEQQQQQLRKPSQKEPPPAAEVMETAGAHMQRLIKDGRSSSDAAREHSTNGALFGAAAIQHVR
eukprot:scaffold79224_cov17-Tisochrysis_lutea.AAC.2